MLRVTLKGMAQRKVRMLLSTLAVLLGVAFVSGALVLTDTLGRSFDRVFSDAYAYIDAGQRRTRLRGRRARGRRR